MNFLHKAFILALANHKKEISPREVAAKFSKNEWHKALPDIKYATWQLYIDGKIELIQKGKVFKEGDELSDVYRMRLKKH